MSGTSKKMIIGSMVAAGLVAVAAAADLAMGFPFAGHVVMDITFLVSAALVMYLGYDAYKELN